MPVCQSSDDLEHISPLESAADRLLGFMVDAEDGGNTPITDHPQWYDLFLLGYHRNGRYDMLGVGILRWGNRTPSAHETLDYLMQQGLVKEQLHTVNTPKGGSVTTTYVPTQAGKDLMHSRTWTL